MKTEAKRQKPLLAYTVHDGGDGWCIRFARSNAAARREGAGELGTDFESIEFCRRRRIFDQYAPGPVPKLALLENGWWFECYGCGRSFDSDYFRGDYFDLDGEDCVDVDRPNPVEHGHGIWCSEECYLRDRADRRRRNQAEAEAREAVAGIVLHRYPGAVITREHAYVEMIDDWYSATQVSIDFLWPGAKHGWACLRFDKGDVQDMHILVPYGDQEAWRAWVAAGYPVAGIGSAAA